MEIPEGTTEQEVMEALEAVANGLAEKFKFGNNTIEDMKQYAKLFALEGLSTYNCNHSASLKTYLWTIVHNKLYNLKRDKHFRPDMPCLSCPLYDPSFSCSTNACSKFEDKTDCELWYKWEKRTNKKKNIVSPIEFGNVRDEQEANMKVYDDVAEKLDNKRIIELIEHNIVGENRISWLRLKSGSRIKKAERTKLFGAIKQILTEEGINV